MKLHLKIALLVGVLALVAAPAAAPAAQPAEPGNGNGHKPAEPGNGHGAAGQGNGPQYSPAPASTKAYGYYCQGESKEHVAGTPGTPFSACVKAHKLAAAHPNMSPGRACKATTGKHIVKGEKGTPHSRCVATVIEQRKEEREAAA
ncbi:MAG: hypothetical protein JSS97_10845 [Actinobacteria bacterium]|nr:hypothetical protein [Actinomycetota bacterium]